MSLLGSSGFVGGCAGRVSEEKVAPKNGGTCWRRGLFGRGARTVGPCPPSGGSLEAFRGPSEAVLEGCETQGRKAEDAYMVHYVGSLVVRLGSWVPAEGFVRLAGAFFRLS